ncbi:MAG: aldo/keto reductase, partial [Chloroflexota bacterium]
GGASETILGNIFQRNRQRHHAVIATKFFNPMGDGINDSGMSRVHVMRAVEESLRRLQTDYIDLYYIHHVDEETPLEEMLWALNDLVIQGKVRYIACSNYECWRLAVAMGISEGKGWHRFECYQPQYNLVVRQIEAEILPLCRYKELGVVVWGPLAGGFLTGKYKPGDRRVDGTRSAEGWVFLSRDFAPNADEILAVLLEVAEEIGREPAQVALRWVL